MDIQPSQLLERCPLCHEKYGTGSIQLLGGEGKTQTFHCACSACGHAMLSVVFEGSGWLSSIGLVTDLQADEAQKLFKTPTITSDECIGIHTSIEQNSAKICQILLEQAQTPRRVTKRKTP